MSFASHSLSMSFFWFWFLLSGLPPLSPPPQMSLSPVWRWGVSRLLVEFLPWEACSQRFHFSLLVSACVGSGPSGKLSCCWLALRVAPPLRHVLGRRGPVQAGPLPGCHFSPSASSQCLAEAVESQGSLLLWAKLGVGVDVCSHLVWERSFRTSKL